MSQLREEQQLSSVLRARGLRSTTERRALIREIFAQQGFVLAALFHGRERMPRSEGGASA